MWEDLVDTNIITRTCGGKDKLYIPTNLVISDIKISLFCGKYVLSLKHFDAVERDIQTESSDNSWKLGLLRLKSLVS